MIVFLSPRVCLCNVLEETPERVQPRDKQQPNRGSRRALARVIPVLWASEIIYKSRFRRTVKITRESGI
jgi:hypothetical protein